MNKRLLSTLVAMLIVSGIYAQEGVKFGFRISPGINLASVVNDSSKQKIDGLTTKAKVGASYGLMLNFGFSETASLHTGLHILHRGYKSETAVTDPASGNTTTFNNNQSVMAVEIPVGLRLRSPEIGTGIYVTGFFGGNVELNVQNKRVFDLIDADTASATFGELIEQETRDTKELNLLTASFQVGLGVDWEFDWGTVMMGASYHRGLMNFINKGLQEDNGSSTILNGKLSYIALDLGYFF